MQAVTIIIPCYRQACFLPAAVESALGQSHRPIQVIVVNDGSDDDTETVAARYEGKIRYIAKSNGGLSSARNAGIKQARGNYMLFLDADDLLHPQAVAWLVEAVGGRENRLVYMGWRRFEDDPLRDSFTDEIPPEAVQPLPRLLRENLSPVHAFLCPRQMILEAGMFEETLRGLEDWDLWTRVALGGAEFATVRRVGAYYRRTPGSMIANRPVMVQARLEILLRAHREIVRLPERLASLGNDLASLEHDHLRARLACRKPDPMVPRLAAALRELNRLGFYQQRSLMVRLLDALIGYRAEFAALAWFRVFRKARLGYYRSLNE